MGSTVGAIRFAKDDRRILVTISEFDAPALILSISKGGYFLPHRTSLAFGPRTVAIEITRFGV
jgi:hypothetical protein